MGMLLQLVALSRERIKSTNLHDGALSEGFFPRLHQICRSKT